MWGGPDGTVNRACAEGKSNSRRVGREELDLRGRSVCWLLGGLSWGYRPVLGRAEHLESRPEETLPEANMWKLLQRVGLNRNQKTPHLLLQVHLCVSPRVTVASLKGGQRDDCKVGFPVTQKPCVLSVIRKNPWICTVCVCV